MFFTVYISIFLASSSALLTAFWTVFSQRFKFSNHREKNIQKATNKAFEMLQKEILKK